MASAASRKASTPLTIEVEGVGIVVVDVPSASLIDEPLGPSSILSMSVTRPEKRPSFSIDEPKTMKLLPKLSEEIIEEEG